MIVTISLANWHGSTGPSTAIHNPVRPLRTKAPNVYDGGVKGEGHLSSQARTGIQSRHDGRWKGGGGACVWWAVSLA